MSAPTFFVVDKILYNIIVVSILLTKFPEDLILHPAEVTKISPTGVQEKWIPKGQISDPQLREWRQFRLQENTSLVEGEHFSLLRVLYQDFIPDARSAMQKILQRSCPRDNPHEVATSLENSITVKLRSTTTRVHSAFLLWAKGNVAPKEEMLKKAFPNCQECECVDVKRKVYLITMGSKGSGANTERTHLETGILAPGPCAGLPGNIPLNENIIASTKNQPPISLWKKDARGKNWMNIRSGNHPTEYSLPGNVRGVQVTISQWHEKKRGHKKKFWQKVLNDMRFEETLQTGSNVIRLEQLEFGGKPGIVAWGVSEDFQFTPEVIQRTLPENEGHELLSTNDTLCLFYGDLDKGEREPWGTYARKIRPSESQSMSDLRLLVPKRLQSLFSELKKSPLTSTYADSLGDIQKHVTNILSTHFQEVDQLENQRQKANTFFHGLPIAQFTKEQLLPAIFAYGKGDEQPLMRALLALPRKAQKGILQNMLAFQSNCEQCNALGEVERTTSIVYALNRSVLGPQNMLLMRTHHLKKSGDTYSLTHVLEGGKWLSKSGDEVIFCSLDVLDPLAVTGDIPCGIHDSDMNIVWVNRRRCEALSEEYQRKDTTVWEGNDSYKTFLDLIHHKNLLPSAKDLEGLAMCEEVKHRINRINRNTTAQSPQPYGLLLNFTSARLRPGGMLHQAWLKTHSLEQKVEFARNVEECNAKLSSAVFGPHPKIDLAHSLANIAYPWLDKTTTGIPSESTLIAAAFLEKNTDDIHWSHMLPFMDTSHNELRTKTWNCMQREFVEDFNDLPFCLVDETGKLCGRDGTHPYFLEWATTLNEGCDEGGKGIDIT